MARNAAAADVLLAALRGPISPLRPEHLQCVSRLAAPPVADRRRETIGDHDDRRRAPLQQQPPPSPSFAQLRERLLEAIRDADGQCTPSDPLAAAQPAQPLPLLAHRFAKMEAEAASPGSAAALDPSAALTEAHVELTRQLEAEGASGGGSSETSAARAYATLHEFCSQHLLLTGAALAASQPPTQPPEHEGSPARTAAEVRRGLLQRIDLQVQLRLALAAIGVGAGVRNEPDKGKGFGELKRLLQL